MFLRESRSKCILGFLGVFVFLCVFGIFLSVKDVSAKSSKITLTYDGKAHEYTGEQAALYFNHKTYKLTSMPIVKINSLRYAPAKEVLQDVFGFSYSYDEQTGEYSAYDEDVDLQIVFKAGDDFFTIVSGGKSSKVTLSGKILMIAKDNDPEQVCVPASKLFKSLGYDSKFDSSKTAFAVQKKKFFDWNAVKEDTDSTINHIYQATGIYDSYDNTGWLDLTFYGDLQSSFSSTTIDRDDKVITVTMPSSAFLPTTKLYDRFGEIAQKMVVTEEEGSVKIVFYCDAVTEFTYTTSGKKLNLKLMWDYSNGTGKITNYSLTFKRPNSTYLIDKVTQYDMYDSVKFKTEFKLVIKGDHKSFYKKHPVVINSNSVKKIKIYLSDNGNTVIKVTTKTLQGYKVSRVGDNFAVMLKKPKKIYKNILVLDAGHGDFDSGCTNKGYKEKNLNLKMIYTLMKKYYNAADCDTKIYWTRRNDGFVTLDARSKFAKKVGADAFISLHMNAASRKGANGTEVYYSTNNNKKKFSGIRSSKMASMMDSALVKAMKTNDRGVRTAGFYVIKRNTVPAILIELGFLTGNKDFKKLTSSTYQKKATKTIHKVIDKMFKKYPTGRK